MCDVEKYSEIYQELKTLQPEDTLQLILESKDEDEQEFFEMLGNYLLQKNKNKL